MTVEQILNRAEFLYARIQLAKDKGTSYSYSTELFRKEIKEMKDLRKQYMVLTGIGLTSDKLTR